MGLESAIEKGHLTSDYDNNTVTLEIPGEFVGAVNSIIEKLYEERRQELRKKFYVPKGVFESVYDAARRYAEATLNTNIPPGEEGRAGGLLLLIVNENEPGMLKPFYLDGRKVLDPQLSLRSENEEGYDLAGVIESIKSNPRSSDLAVVVNLDGNVISKKAFINGVYDSNTTPRNTCSLTEGNARHSAARSFTERNTYAIAVLVSASSGNVKVFQEGLLKMEYDPETRIIYTYSDMIYDSAN